MRDYREFKTVEKMLLRADKGVSFMNLAYVQSKLPFNLYLQNINIKSRLKLYV